MLSAQLVKLFIIHHGLSGSTLASASGFWDLARNKLELLACSSPAFEAIKDSFALSDLLRLSSADI